MFKSKKIENNEPEEPPRFRVYPTYAVLRVDYPIGQIQMKVRPVESRFDQQNAEEFRDTCVRVQKEEEKRKPFTGVPLQRTEWIIRPLASDMSDFMLVQSNQPLK